MIWKCLLVGLALVLSGVEGRYYSDQSRAVSQQDGFLNALFHLLEQQHQPAKYNQEDIPVPGAQQELDVNTNQQEIVPEQEPPAGNADAPALPRGPVTTKKRERSGAGEINHAVQEPQHQAQSGGAFSHGQTNTGMNEPSTIFIMVVAGCTVLAAVGIVGAGVCWYKYHKSAKAASVVDYPAYGVTGPTKDRIPSPGDRKLAHSAQMYHYQHQKQQMMALQSASSGEMKHDGSDDESVEDNDDADYTVYECPGLAPTGEMEVKNPLFRGDDTPSTPANDDTRPPPPEY